MSNQIEEPTFNVKRARWVLYVFAFAFLGIFSYLQFANIINIHVFGWLMFADVAIAILTNYWLRKNEREQKEREKFKYTEKW